MPEVSGLVEIEIKTPLPSECAVGGTYTIEGVAKVADKVGPPPWLYAQVQKKDWYKPEILEETSYWRGFPIPITGKFSIDWTPNKTGIYEVTVVATPAPLSLPVVGVPPITGQSSMMKVSVGEMGKEVSKFKIVTYRKEGEEMVTPGTVITVDPGEEIEIDVEFTYEGPHLRETLYGVLYGYTLGYVDEVGGSANTAVVDTEVDILTPTAMKGSVVIPVPNRPGETFGILTKLGNIASDKIDDVVKIAGAPAPTVTKFRITGYSKV